jgi:hypothetical protein
MFRAGMNPMQMMNAIRNPKAFLQQMMNNPQYTNNPMARNIFDMVQKGDIAGVEQFGRNVAQSRGVDFDKEYQNFMNQFGMK